MVSLLPAFLAISYIYIHPLPIRATCHVHLIFLDLIILIVQSTSYEAPHYAVFSNLLSLHLSLVQIFSSAPCFRTPSVYVPPLKSEPRFHTHREPRCNLALPLTVLKYGISIAITLFPDLIVQQVKLLRAK
jgi:hypothetical protein